MKSKSILALVALFSAIGISQSVEARTSAGALLAQPKRSYIVKSQSNDGNLDGLQSVISNALGRKVAFDETFSNIMTGAVVDLTAAEADVLETVDGITIGNNNVYATPTAEAVSSVVSNPKELASSNFSQDTMHADYKEAENKGKGIKIGIVDTGLFYDQIASKADDTSYKAFRPLTADALNDRSLTEASVGTAIKNKDFHGKTGKYVNSKIAFTYDYSEEDGNVQPKAGNEHGTHVASLAAGNGASYDGMAPNAQLAILKVFGDQGGATSQDVLEALEDAKLLGLDEVNLSLGSAFINYPDKNSYKDSIEYQVIQDLQNSGVLVNVAAGNDGRGELAGIYSNYVSSDVVDTGELGSYAVLDSANVVGSSTLSKAYTYYWTLPGSDTHIEPTDQVSNVPLSGLVKNSGDTLPYQVVGSVKDGKLTISNGKTEDYAGLSVKGKVAVISRGGGVTFESMAKNAQAQGAIALIVINNAAEELNMSFGTFSPAIPVALVDMSVANLLTADTVSGVLTYSSVLGDNPLQNTSSLFTSDGMTLSLGIKPDISAPGTGVLGAVMGGYQEMSGTSMAAPNLTGALALALGEHNGSAEELASYKNGLMARAMSTADILEDSSESSKVNKSISIQDTNNKYVKADGSAVSGNDKVAAVDGNYATPKTQGAGQVNVHKLLTSDVWTSTGYTDGGDGQVIYDQSGKLTSQSVSKQLTNKITFGVGVDASKEKLNLSEKKVTLHNEGKSAKSYTARMYVAISEKKIPLDSKTWSNFTETAKKIYTMGFTATQLKSNDLIQAGDIYLGTYTAKASSDTTITLPDVDLTASNEDSDAAYYLKQYINSNYAQGTTIEGYIVLTPTSSDSDSSHSTDGQLSIPYLAFYGDYGAADATEKFDFEKESFGEIYTSDLANAFAKSYVNYENPNAYFGSSIYGISNVKSEKEGLNMLATTWTTSGYSLSHYGAQHLGWNSYFGAQDSGVVAGVSGVSDQLLIQQFIQRDMDSASIDLVKPGDGEGSQDTVISTTKLHGFPNLDEDVEGSDDTYFGQHLFRSLPIQTHLESGYYVNMGGAFLDLKDNTGKALAEGQYKLVFHYTLMAKDAEGKAITQTKEVPLTINRSAVAVESVGIDEYGSPALTASENAEYIIFKADQTTAVNFTETSDGKKKVILNGQYAKNGLIHATIVNANGNTKDVVIDSRGANPVLLYGKVDGVSSIVVDRTEADGKVKFGITAYNSKGNIDNNYAIGSHGFVIYIDKGLASDTVFKSYNSRGAEKILAAGDYYYDAKTGMFILYDSSNARGITYSI